MNACRVCMEIDKNQEFTSMFIDNGKNASRFSILTGLIVTELSGDKKVLICDYCSIQLELFSQWRERCKKYDTFFRNGLSHAVVPKQQTSLAKKDVIPTVDLTNEELYSKEKSEMITSINDLLTNMKTAFDPTTLLQGYECLPHQNENRYPAENNANESVDMCQSMKCRICHRMFQSANQCKMHFKKQHPLAKQYDCKFCKRSFKRPIFFYNHMLRHESGHIPLVCSQCNMTFQSKENYSLHVQSHENELHVNVPFTTNDREMIIKSWNENSLPKYPRLHSVNYV